MNPPAPLHYPRLTPTEARAIIARNLGSLVHPAKPEAAIDTVRGKWREYRRRQAMANIARGLTWNGKPRKRPYHPNIRHGLTKDRAAYMRWWRSRKRQSNSKAPA